MKITALIILLGLFFLISCKKERTTLSRDLTNPEIQAQNFQKYTIRQGQQYCDQNTYSPVNFSEFKFMVRFDSTAIYTTKESENQYDINKLYGFSDNNLDHHKFSARFGWRWSDSALWLFAYTYNNGVRAAKELGTVIIDSENFCSIKIEASTYIFTLNDKSDTLQRKSNTKQAVGYKLYPYFGGDEVAPHDINIFIKDLS